MSGNKQVLAISGSTRKGSSNESILKYLSARYSSQLHFEFYENLSRLPHFNPDLDQADVPDEVLHMRQSIVDADGILICTPEYIFALPGALKNLIEWLVSTTIMDNKPVAFVVASGLGERSFDSLTVILKTLSARIGADSSLLLQGARAKIDTNGNPKDEFTASSLDKLMKSFITSMNADGIVSQ